MDWLQTGEGDMFLNGDTGPIWANDPAADRPKTITSIAETPENMRLDLMGDITDLISSLSASLPATDPADRPAVLEIIKNLSERLKSL